MPGTTILERNGRREQGLLAPLPLRSPLGLPLRLAAHADDGDAGRNAGKHGKNHTDNGHAGLGEVLAVAVPVRPGWIRP